MNKNNTLGGAINLRSGASANVKVVNNSIYNASSHSAVIIILGSSLVKPIVTGNSTDEGPCVTSYVPGTQVTSFIIKDNL